MNDRYKKSESLLEKALKVIPLGSQTFSKSVTQFPLGVSPYFIDKGKGARVWDVDGNEYIDFMNGLLAVNLGYQDTDVDSAVQEQMQNGVIFSLAHPLEQQLAEKIIEMVPCAEMVRFGKNGSDVTSGAIRLARAYTGREHVTVCGYHGWQDWYIGSTSRDLGVPQSTKQLTHKFSYNDLSSLENLFDEHKDKIAAVIMEPMNVEFPKNNFLQKVKDLAHKHGAVFIFDETITGFRFAEGGAQEYFGVISDLATFGKGMANGYPISALVGRKEIMSLITEIFFSFTFGGETLSIAAALATLEKIQKKPVIKHLSDLGNYLIENVKQLVDKYHMKDFLEIKGHPAWSFMIFKDYNGISSWEIKTLWLQEIFARGILSIGTHNLSYAHTKENVDQLFAVYDDVFPIIQQALSEKNIKKYLKCEVLKPLFSVR